MKHTPVYLTAGENADLAATITVVALYNKPLARLLRLFARKVVETA